MAADLSTPNLEAQAQAVNAILQRSRRHLTALQIRQLQEAEQTLQRLWQMQQTIEELAAQCAANTEGEAIAETGGEVVADLMIDVLQLPRS
jgi:hypothetical protein